MRKLVVILLAATSLLTTLAAACAADHVPTPELTVGPLDADHTLLGRVLARIVKPDGVDYAALRSDAAGLDDYRAQLAKTLLPSDAAANKALFINAYNAWTLALVARLLPADPARWTAWSIKDGGSTLASVWKRHSFELGGRRYTLDQVEHEVLRPMADPRIHFAINCASKSCPRLADAPYLAATLDAQLDAATATFLADPTQLRLSGAKLMVNPILDWFSADFERVGGVRRFLLDRLPTGPARTLLASDGTLAFFDYDWRLNLARSRP